MPDISDRLDVGGNGHDDHEIIITGPGIDCGIPEDVPKLNAPQHNDCAEVYNPRTQVSLDLSEKVNIDYEFTGWGGDCAILNTGVPLIMGSFNKTCIAYFIHRGGGA